MTLKRCGSNNEGWQVGDTGACYAGPDGRLLATRAAAPQVAKEFTSMSQFDVNRTLFMFDDFCQETAQQMVAGLLKLDAQSSEPINIVINSYGGSVYSLFSILDTMGNLNSQINTICMGEADSCGAVLLAAGDFRYIGKNSRTMIHEISTVTWGKISELAKEIASAQELNDRLVGILARHTGQNKAQLGEVMKTDTFLNAEESVKMGLVDHILDAKDMMKVMGFTVGDKKLVASAKSRTADALITDILAQKIQKGEELNGPMNILDQIKALFVENTEKGDDSPMKKEEMFAALKAEHGLDIDAMLSENSELVARVSTLETEHKTVVAELDTYKKSVESDKIEELLSGLISEGKSSQALNDTIYRAHFQSVGYEKAVVVAKAIPKSLKTDQVGTSSADSADDTLTDAAREDLAIQAIAKEKSLNYSDAEKEYKRREREAKGVK